MGLKTSHESEMVAAAGGAGFGWKCDRENGGLWPANGDRENGGLWPANGDGDDDKRLDALLSSSLLVRRYSSFSLKSAILMYEMLGFFCYLLRFLYPLGVQNGSVLFESLFHGCEYLIRESLFCNFFCFSGSVFGSMVCFGFCFQRL